MFTCANLWDIHLRICAARQVDPFDPDVLPFAGLHVVVTFDFHQLAAIGRALYDEVKGAHLESLTYRGWQLWRRVATYHELDRPHRFEAVSGTNHLVRFLDAMRVGDWCAESAAHVNAECVRTSLTALFREMSPRALWLAPTHAERRTIIGEHYYRRLLAKKKSLRIWAHHHPKRGKELTPDLHAKLLAFDPTPSQASEDLPPPSLLCTPGHTRLYLTTNMAPSMGLYHNAMGTLLKIGFPDLSLLQRPFRTMADVLDAGTPPPLPVLFVQMDYLATDPTTGKPFSVSSKIPRLVAVVPQASKTTYYGFYRYMLPLAPAECRTNHAAQGLNPQFGVVLSPSQGPPFAMSLEYFAASRAKSLAALRLRRPLTAEHAHPRRHERKRALVHAEYDHLRRLPGLPPMPAPEAIIEALLRTFLDAMRKNMTPV
mmetsp:Transcript_16608/g.54092  ORF Transcript_16608/g.54092 Transcript_16608/m.54092 type:complete len:428 (+) Transcript_16608:250-1533(+)